MLQGHDQVATVAALPVAVALDEAVTVAYLPGLAMRRIVDLRPGTAKTDARDAAVIATAARTMPHTLQALQLDDEAIAELTAMSGYDDDLAGQITATSNRIRALLTQIHSALERVLGPRLDHPALLDLLETRLAPAALTTTGQSRVRTRLLKRAPRLGARLTEEIFAALAAQIVVTGTDTTGVVLPRLAAQLAALRQQRAEVAVDQFLLRPHLQHLASGGVLQRPAEPALRPTVVASWRQPDTRPTVAEDRHGGLRLLPLGPATR